MQSFCDSDFWLDLSHVALGAAIGAGAFSTVYKGNYFGDDVAVKKQVVEGEPEAYLMRELGILKSFSHPNLIEYVGACHQSQAGLTPDDPPTHHIFTVTEYLPRGDLETLLQDWDTFPRLGWKLRCRIACGAASGLSHLHAHGIIHRDIKSQNILLDCSLRAKICDFGFARRLGAAETRRQDPTRRQSICGTDECASPPYPPMLTLQPSHPPMLPPQVHGARAAVRGRLRRHGR
jgi:serine/threonine protein kinase